MPYSHLRYAETISVKEMRDDVYGLGANLREPRALRTLAATLLLAFATLLATALPAQAQTNTPATGQPTITGPPQVGKTLTAETDDIADENGVSNVVFTYQWVRVDGMTETDIAGETSSTYEVVAADVDKKIKVKVSFTDDEGNAEGPLTSDAYPSNGTTVVATNTPATGQPTITGTPQVGKMLTAETDDIADENGVPAVAMFTYQWVRVDGTDEDIAGATSSTYQLVAADVGKKVKVKVSFTDELENAEGPLTSDAYPSNGTVVAANGACPSDADWCGILTMLDEAGFFVYEEKSGSLTNNPFEHLGVEYNIYTVFLENDTEPEIVVGVDPHVPLGTVYKFDEHTFTTDEESENTLDANSWPVPSDLVWHGDQEITFSLVFGSFSAEGTVWISGTAKEGQTLTAYIRDVSDPDGLTSPSYTRQWVRVDGTDETDIAGATSGTYRLVAADVGKKVKVRISFTDDEGNPETLTTDEYPSGVDSIENAPVFGGTHGTRHLAETVGAAKVETAANIGTPVRATDPGNEPLTYSLEGTDADKFTFVSSSGQIRTKVGERYDYETDPSYAVTGRADNANGEWATIDVTINIINNTNEQPLAPTAVTVAATIGNTMSLDVSWTAPDNTGRPAITSYDLRYQKVTETAWTDGPQDVTGTSASIADLDQGTQYRVAVRATNADGDGPWSSTSDGDGDGDDRRAPDGVIGRTTLPAVRFGGATYTAIEGLSGATVTVELSSAASSSATVPLTATPQGGATASDYSGVPASVTFAPGETQKTFTVTATNDAVDDDGESVRIGFGTLPSSVVVGSPSTATVTLLEEAGLSIWYVFFGESSYTATEGGARASVTVGLSAPWKPELNQALTVPLYTPTPQGGATEDDFSGVPASVTFQPGQTQKTFTVRATDDSDDDDGESVLLQFGNGFPEDLKLGRGPDTSTVHLADNDGVRAVKVFFGASTYTAVEGGATATVSVHLDAAPGRSVTVPLTTETSGAYSGDYSGVPTSVTFGASETQQTFTVTATNDAADDDFGSVTLGFGSLPSRVSAGSPSTATVYLTDNDGGQEMLTVTFDGWADVSRTVREGRSYWLGVNLDKAPDWAVTIPLVVENLDGATANDYTVPSSVTFQLGERKSGVIVRGVDDSEEDPGEGFRVSFGTLPAGVRVSTSATATFTIIDNDGFPGISVSGASAQEHPNPVAYLKFVVRLSEDAEHEVQVDYKTRDGSAKAGEDYVATSGTLVFDEGDREEFVWVEVIHDLHNEDLETMTLVLSNPVRAKLVGATAEGRINNRFIHTNSMPRAVLARFGRATAVEVVEQVEARLEARRERGFEARFAGQPLRSGMERDLGRDFLNRLGAATDAPPQSAGEFNAPGFASVARGADPDWRGLLQTSFQKGDVLTGSAFELNQATRQGGAFSLWGRGAQSRFVGREGVLSLGGRVRTTMLGADYSRGSLVMGLPLFHSRSQGNYSGVDLGEVISSVTGLYPWVGYKATERVTLWGVTGYGQGTLSLTPGEDAALKSELSMAMAAAGLRGDLAASVKGGFGLAVKADALWVDTGVEGVESLSSQLAAAAAAVSRFRTALEASRGYDFGSGLSLQPSLEVGLRRDAGDAETGAGVDLGGGLVVTDPLTGISADVRIRMLLVHQAEGFGERGGSVRLSLDPTPLTPLGFKAQVAPSWGGRATSGAEALWSRETMAGLAAGGSTSGSRFDADFGYGLPVGSRLVGTPSLGLGTAEGTRDYRLGYQLTLLHDDAVHFALGVDATRRESLRQGDEDHRVLGRVTTRW